MRYTVILMPGDADDESIAITVPAIPGCLSQADSRDEVTTMAREVIELCLEEYIERNEPVPADDPAKIAQGVISSLEILRELDLPPRLEVTYVDVEIPSFAVASVEPDDVSTRLTRWSAVATTRQVCQAWE